MKFLLLLLLSSSVYSRELIINGKLFTISDTNNTVIIDIPMPVKIERVEVPVYQDSAFDDLDLDDDSCACPAVKPEPTVESYESLNDYATDDSKLGGWDE